MFNAIFPWLLLLAVIGIVGCVARMVAAGRAAAQALSTAAYKQALADLDDAVNALTATRLERSRSLLAEVLPLCYAAQADKLQKASWLLDAEAARLPEASNELAALRTRDSSSSRSELLRGARTAEIIASEARMAVLRLEQHEQALECAFEDAKNAATALCKFEEAMEAAYEAAREIDEAGIANPDVRNWIAAAELNLTAAKKWMTDGRRAAVTFECQAGTHKVEWAVNRARELLTARTASEG